MPRLIPAVLSVAVGLASALMGVGLATAPAQADDTTTLLAVAGGGQTLDHPAVLTTTSAVSSVAAWTSQTTVGGAVVRVLQVRHQSRLEAWTPSSLDLGGLDSIGEPFLVQDPATGRVLLTASASRNGALDATLGTYVWYSADDGATFVGPKRVLSGFGIGDAAPDGAGGFWTTTGQAGVYVAHVNASYDAEAPIQLTDRVGSRGAMALTTGGAARIPVLAFQAGENGLWAHHGTASGQGQDTQLFPTGDGLHVGVAGNATGVLVAAVRGDGGTGKVLVARTVDPTTGAAGPEQRISPADAVFFEVRPLAAGALAAWNDAAGDVYSASTVGGLFTGTWSATKVLSGSASGVDYISKPDVSSNWTMGLGNRSSDSAGVVWITRNAPVSEKPTVSAKGVSSYSAKKRSIALNLRAGAPATAKATVLISGIAKKMVKKGYSFKVTKPGKLTQKLKLPKKLAAQLASSPKAKIKVKVTVKNAAGKDAVTIRVVRR